MSDFSFDGVSAMIDRQFGAVLRGELSAEQEAEARKLMALSEGRRQKSMEQYMQDGVVPFMRSELLKADAKTIQLAAEDAHVKIG
jgi:hypothetical protein